MESFSLGVKCFRFVALILIIFLCASVTHSQTTTKITKNLKNAQIDIELRNQIVHLVIKRKNGSSTRNVLHTIGSKLSTPKPSLTLENCGPDVCMKANEVTVTLLEIKNDFIRVKRNVSDPEAKLIDCFEFAENVQWFGGPQQRYQHWPIQNMYYQEEPYLPTHPINLAIAERYWLSGEGVYLYVEPNSPLFLDQNNYKDNNLCLVVKNKAPYRERDVIQLEYEIGIFANPRLAHENVVKRYLKKPTNRPNERMIKHPIWSTWARYKAQVSSKVIDNFTDEIIAYKFNNSQVEIDDNWETCYGSAEFNPSKFPDVQGLIQKIKRKGFRVTLWIHPFINSDCNPAYDDADKNSYFVKNLNGKVHTQWWQGQNAAIVDFTNPKAVNWWVSRLKKLERLGIDSFKFDAGEVSWLPQVAKLAGSVDLQPGIFTRDYVTTLAKNFDDNIEVRVGWQTQDLPIFVRMIDKDTSWTWNNGLPTLITTLLQMNLNGYVHVLPDMIGGNGYLNGFLNGTIYPPKELFIRWLQANTFMPSLQYSFVPWDFDDETVTISKKFTDLHAKITPEIIQVMDKAVTTGAPVNPPIWWIDPTNKIAHKIKDEYLLGEKYLVAPVIEEGAIFRDVYLPAGKWKDGNSDNLYLGPGWIRDYSAPLNTLPYFIKQ